MDHVLGLDHRELDRISIKRKADVEVPRSFSDYEVTVDGATLPPGVTLIKRV